jgi:D-serine deaminase-like pyridoxal phosphate-dependent protein
VSDYARYSKAIEGQRLPIAIVDLDAFDHNVRLIAKLAKNKPLRVATKSVRVPALLDRIREIGGNAFRGLMTYSSEETAFLAERGERDLLVAYPTMLPSDAEILASLAAQGVVARVVVDSVAQIDLLATAGRRAKSEIPIVIELDMAFRPLPSTHLGVRRSPLRTPEDVVHVAKHARATDGVRFSGIMGYEAQIAGVADRDGTMLAPLKRAMKQRSVAEIVTRRASVAKALLEDGFEIEIFNGGGTGSVLTSSCEETLTEITAGSGFLDSHLFDGYDGIALKPAIFFALQVVRRASPTIVTCLGGGYIASGGAGKSRLPTPALPENLSLLDLEGAGEVQTPLDGAHDLSIGSPVFFRHAKAGELAEHFNDYALVRGDTIVERVKTYRGLGHCFLG